MYANSCLRTSVTETKKNCFHMCNMNRPGELVTVKISKLLRFTEEDLAIYRKISSLFDGEANVYFDWNGHSFTGCLKDSAKTIDSTKNYEEEHRAACVRGNSLGSLLFRCRTYMGIDPVPLEAAWQHG